jgi:hypothetical protein
MTQTIRRALARALVVLAGSVSWAQIAASNKAGSVGQAKPGAATQTAAVSSQTELRAVFCKIGAIDHS